MGQYYWGQGAYKSEEGYDRDGYLAEAFVRIPNLEKLRLFGKYYYFDPNDDVKDDEYKTYVAGVSYDFSKEFMPFIAYEKREYETQTSKLMDYDKIQVGFQLKF
jgi:predicted porin